MIGTAKRGLRWLMALGAATSIAGTAGATASYQRQPFGHLPDGTLVEAITLRRATTEVTIITLGASIQAVRIPDRKGRIDDVVLGCPDAASCYVDPRYFGATIGRVANRIANASFELDGKRWQLTANNGVNTLHGGTQGFDKRVWQIVTAGASPNPEVSLRLVSPDGDQGFPGTLTVTVNYWLDAGGALHIDYEATTDKPTLVALSNHSYWNLAGVSTPEGALGQLLQIPADQFLPVDDRAIPTGELRSVVGSAFDFREPQHVDARIRDASSEQLRLGHGYDHAFVLARSPAQQLRLAARLSDQATGRTLEVLTDQPALQLYTANFLDGAVQGKYGRLYRQGDGIALEPEALPDAANRAAFGSIRLAPPDIYQRKIVYQFSAH